MNLSRFGLCLWLFVLLKWSGARSFGPSFTLLKSNGESRTQNFLQQSNAVLSRPISLWKNSPVYYIKLAPTSNNFVSNEGYVNRPQKEKPFFSVPYLANGRPHSVFALSKNGAAPSVQTINSPIIRLPGKFAFNGKPSRTVASLKSPYYSQARRKNGLNRNHENRRGHSRRRSKIDHALWGSD